MDLKILCRYSRDPHKVTPDFGKPPCVLGAEVAAEY